MALARWRARSGRWAQFPCACVPRPCLIARSLCFCALASHRQGDDEWQLPRWGARWRREQEACLGMWHLHARCMHSTWILRVLSCTLQVFIWSVCLGHKVYCSMVCVLLLCTMFDFGSSGFFLMYSWFRFLDSNHARLASSRRRDLLYVTRLFFLRYIYCRVHVRLYATDYTQLILWCNSLNQETEVGSCDKHRTLYGSKDEEQKKKHSNL